MGLLLSGKNPAALKTAERQTFTATAGQTTFTTTGYTVGDIDVYLNGLKLVDSDDYYATNGTTVVLTSGASAGDSLSVVFYNQFLAANTYTKAESDSRYIGTTSTNPMQTYLRTPNYGISSYSDSAFAALEASAGQGTNGVGIKAWGRSISGSGGELTYVTDTRGASGQHIFYGWNGSGLTKFGGFDASGRWSAPLQPQFYAWRSGGVSTTSTGVLVWDQTRTNIGGGYSTSTGRFTAPVTGNYLFFAHVLHRGNGTSGNLELTFYKNGSNINSRGFVYSVASQSSGHIPCQTTLLMPLVAGDYIQTYVHTVASGSDCYYGDNLGHFSGFLLG